MRAFWDGKDRSGAAQAGSSPTAPRTASPSLPLVTHRPKSLSRSVWRPPRVAPPVRAAILVLGAGRVHKRAAALAIGPWGLCGAVRGAGEACRGLFANFWLLSSPASGPGGLQWHRQVRELGSTSGLRVYAQMLACWDTLSACCLMRPGSPALILHSSQLLPARTADHIPHKSRPPLLKRSPDPPVSASSPPAACSPTQPALHLIASSLRPPGAGPPHTVWLRPASRRRVRLARRRPTSSACWTAMRSSRSGSHSSRWAG